MLQCPVKAAPCSHAQLAVEKVEISVTALYTQLRAAFVFTFVHLPDSKSDGLVHVRIHKNWQS